jgi:hypothetical protein
LVLDSDATLAALATRATVYPACSAIASSGNNSICTDVERRAFYDHGTARTATATTVRVRPITGCSRRAAGLNGALDGDRSGKDANDPAPCSTSASIVIVDMISTSTTSTSAQCHSGKVGEPSSSASNPPTPRLRIGDSTIPAGRAITPAAATGRGVLALCIALAAAATIAVRARQ